MLPLLASRLSMHGGHMICQVGILIELYVTGGADVRPPPCAAGQVPLQLGGGVTYTLAAQWGAYVQLAWRILALFSRHLLALMAFSTNIFVGKLCTVADHVKYSVALLLQAIVVYHMFVHDVCFVERFGAIRAPELFLLHVCFHVIFRCVLIVEGLSIEFALVSLEFHMLLNVQLELRSLGELPRTKVTLKWVFLCVGPHMLLQITVLVC